MFDCTKNIDTFVQVWKPLIGLTCPTEPNRPSTKPLYSSFWIGDIFTRMICSSFFGRHFVRTA